MRSVFKVRDFTRWMRAVALTDKALCSAVSEMESGLFDADLGSGIFKKRVGLAGPGKRGGARTIIATNQGDRWFFVFGFAKNERSNITNRELSALKLLANDLMERTCEELDGLVGRQALWEICHDAKE